MKYFVMIDGFDKMNIIDLVKTRLILIGQLLKLI